MRPWFPSILTLLFLGCDTGGTSPVTPSSSVGSGGGGVGGSGGQAGTSGMPGLDECKAACVKVDALACPQNPPGQCDELCESSAKVTACSKEYTTYSTCAAAATWQCEGGVAKVAICEKQLSDLADCLNEKGSGTGILGQPGHFFCDKLVCDGSASQRACCLKFDPAKLGVDAQCVSSIDQCGQDSRWECDGPDDCGGRPCCWSNPTTGSGQIILGFCRNSCNFFAGEREVCQDTCSGGLHCCKKPGEDIGFCEQSKAACDSKPSEEN
ncbi:MAG: hypothetical protein RMJ98_21280 [Myxococcales bacterium]|nr:hypothetical protein [Polyangiaceae bacterium]MDW8251838.1 hypothetical protein [Myxococcales bacterium]